jgi:polysaccharide export outer membrane protein
MTTLMTRRLAGLTALGALLSGGGCSGNAVASFRKPASPEVVKSLNRYTREYILQPGDQIEVTVFRVPDASRTVVVRSDGKVSLPIVREVRAAGLTVPAFTEDLEHRYGERLVDPDVSVSVINPREARVFVLGEVVKPGPIAYRTVATAAQAIAEAGGIARTGSQTRVALVRLDDEGYLVGQAIGADPRDPVRGDAGFYVALQQMVLQPGDLIIVPESGRSEFVRAVNDFVTTPVGALNQLLTPYYQFKLLSLLD